MTIKATISGPLVSLEALGVLAEADLDALFQAFEKARSAGPFVVITDTTRMKSAPAAVLSTFGSKLKKMSSLANIWLGDAVVVNSPTVRFALSTLLIVAPMPTETKVFDQMAEARRWCAWILRRAGLAVPPPLLASA